jgi:hypothetical protein
VKRLAIVTIAAVAALGIAAGPASGQTDSTTTTVAPSTTTTVVPATTTTVAAATTTTAAPTPTTTAPAPPPIALPGEHVAGGQLQVGATFAHASASSCSLSGSVAGGQVNVMKDEKGNIGVVYGKASLGSGDAGLVMVALGPLPLAIGAYRATGSCNQDVIAVGPYRSTPTSTSMDGIGYGLYPKDFAPTVHVSLDVAGTQPTAALDLQGAVQFLTLPRPAG